MTDAVATDLPAAVIDAVADRVADILVERGLLDGVPERWLTTEEAAAHLAVSTSQLYTWVSQRHFTGLPVIKEGSRSYFRASDLDRWRREKSLP